MTLIAEIEAVRDYQLKASEDFRAQLNRMRELRERMGFDPNGDHVSQDRGIDRSKELTPIQRPAILRTVEPLAE